MVTPGTPVTPATPGTPDPAEAPPRQPPLIALLPGAVIVLLGVGFLLNNFGMLHVRIWCLWPLLLVAVGLARILQRTVPDLIWGVTIAGFGVGIMLECLDIVHIPFWQLWPIFLIAAGVHAVWAAFNPGAAWGRRHWTPRRLRRWDSQAWAGNPEEWTKGAEQWGKDLRARIEERARASATPVSEDWMHISAVFSESKRRVYNNTFRGGTASAVFGGCMIDLRAMGTPAQPVVIEANAMLGGIEIYVPSTWSVVLEGVGILGAYQDETFPSPQVEGPRGKIIVRGTSILGGVTIKN